MVIIPLQAVPSQNVTVQIADQNCDIKVYQLATGVFVDLYVNSALVVGGVIGRNLVRMVRDLYLGFAGDLLWIDSEGTSDPEYTGIGTRYALAYLEASELPPGVG